MTPLVTTLLLFGTLLLLLFFGAPLLVAIGLPTAVVMLLSGMNVAAFAQRMFVAVDSFTMMAIPFFMLAGGIMESGGISKQYGDHL